MKSSVFISHILAAGAGIYGLKVCTSRVTILPTIAYSLITLHNGMGITKYFLNSDDNVEEIYNFSQFLQLLFPFPCIVGELWLQYGLQKEICYLHPALSIIPLLSKLLDKDLHKENTIKAIMLLNAISGLYVSIIKENWMGVASTVAFAITFGVIQSDGRGEDKADERNVGVCIATILSYFALGFIASKF